MAETAENENDTGNVTEIVTVVVTKSVTVAKNVTVAKSVTVAGTVIERENAADIGVDHARKSVNAAIVTVAIVTVAIVTVRSEFSICCCM